MFGLYYAFLHTAVQYHRGSRNDVSLDPSFVSIFFLPRRVDQRDHKQIHWQPMLPATRNLFLMPFYMRQWIPESFFSPGKICPTRAMQEETSDTELKRPLKWEWRDH